MSVRLMSKVWEKDLAHSEQSLLLAMADYADDDGRNCYPSYDRLSWKTGYSKRQVQRIIQELCGKGILVVLRPSTQHQATHYWIRIDKAKDKAPFSVDISDNGSSVDIDDKESASIDNLSTLDDFRVDISDNDASVDKLSTLNDASVDIDDIQSRQMEHPGWTFATSSVDMVSTDPSVNHHIEPSEETEERDAGVAPAPPETWNDFLIAFCWVCHGHKDLGALTEKQKGILTSEAKRIYDKNYTIDDLRSWFRDKWQKDWHWTKDKQHERPAPSDVRSMIPSIRDTEPVQPTNGYQVDEPDFREPFGRGVYPLAPPANPQPPPLPPPRPHDDPWAIALAEMLPTLSSQARAWLEHSELSMGEIAGEPLCEILVKHPSANVEWLKRLEPTIRKKLGSLLHKRVNVGFVLVAKEPQL